MITARSYSCVSFCTSLLRKDLTNTRCYKTPFTFMFYNGKRNFVDFTKSKISTQCLIKEITEVSRDHLTPEISLQLITQNCPLWYSGEDQCPFPDPFWAFYWPGGQALTRFILENGELFRGKTVVDVGCGCGASSIACQMVGADHVIANDIDTVAAEAVELNTELNNVTQTTITTSNLVGCHDNRWDTVLFGDMFYDTNFANIITEWVVSLHKNGVAIYIGDPGRLPFEQHPLKSDLRMVAEYALPENCLKENNGLSCGFVWKYVPGNT